MTIRKIPKTMLGIYSNFGLIQGHKTVCRVFSSPGFFTVQNNKQSRRKKWGRGGELMESAFGY